MAPASQLPNSCSLAVKPLLLHPPVVQLTVTLLDGVAWDDVPYLLLWCEEYYADFGHVKLERGTPCPRLTHSAPPVSFLPARC